MQIAVVATLAAPILCGIPAATLLLGVQPASDVSPDSSRLITEAQFLQPLLAGEHPSIPILDARVDTARALQIEARTPSDPVIAGSVEDPSGGERELEASASWEPPRPDRRRLEIRAAGAGVAASEASREAELLRLELEARAAFARWWLEDRTATLLAARTARLSGLAARQRARADAGEAAGLEARRAELAAAHATSEGARASGRLEAARAEAELWTTTTTVGAHPERPPLPSPPALAESPAALESLRHSLTESELQRRATDKVFDLPEVTLGWKRVETPTRDFDGPVAALAWRVPLFERRRAERLAAGARLAALEAALEIAESNVARRRPALLAMYEELRRRSVAIVELLAASTDDIDRAEEAFDLGELDLTDLLDTLRLDLEVRLEALRLHAGALEAWRALRQLEADPFTASQPTPAVVPP